MCALSISLATSLISIRGPVETPRDLPGLADRCTCSNRAVRLVARLVNGTFASSSVVVRCLDREMVSVERVWVIPFVARPVSDGIELSGEREGTRLRWRFSGVTPDSFSWQAEETPPGGEPWVRQRFEARRSWRR